MSITLVLATIINGLLAGASLDQSIEQLPARHRIGVRAYLEYSRASHMANGRYWLIPLGIVGPLLTIVAGIWALWLKLPTKRSVPLFLAGGLGVANLLSTVQAARINWTLTPWQPDSQKIANDEDALTKTFQQFEHWQTVRASVQLLTFLAAVWALAANGFAAFNG
jgi:hypothetical protein